MLRPAAEAINNVANWDTTVEFTLTGEQGLSVFTYPWEWAGLLDRVKGISAKCAWGVCVWGEVGACVRACVRARLWIDARARVSAHRREPATAAPSPHPRAAPPRNKDASRHLAGVSFNWDKICGCVEPEEKDPIM